LESEAIALATVSSQAVRLRPIREPRSSLPSSPGAGSASTYSLSLRLVRDSKRTFARTASRAGSLIQVFVSCQREVLVTCLNVSEPGTGSTREVTPRPVSRSMKLFPSVTTNSSCRKLGVPRSG
jgi:hypothetical protein